MVPVSIPPGAIPGAGTHHDGIYNVVTVVLEGTHGLRSGHVRLRHHQLDVFHLDASFVNLKEQGIRELRNQAGWERPVSLRASPTCSGNTSRDGYSTPDKWDWLWTCARCLSLSHMTSLSLKTWMDNPVGKELAGWLLERDLRNSSNRIRGDGLN